MLVSTKYFYIAELVQIPVLTAHYGESSNKTCLYEDFLNLYGATVTGKETVFLPPGSLYQTLIKV
jgi:hypothetical protein